MTETRALRRPRLKPYVFFKETRDGVLFDAGRHSFVVQGANIYPLVAKIIELMDAGRAHDEIERAMPEIARPVFAKLIEALRAHRMLTDAETERAILSEYPERPPFVDFLRYLQDHLDEYRAPFDGWRMATVALVGNGYALKSAANALGRSGVGALEITHLSRVGQRPGPEEIERALAAVGAADPGFAYRVDSRDELPATLAAHVSFALVVSDDLDDLLARRHFSGDAPLFDVPHIVAGVLDRRGVVSPPSEKGFADFRDLHEALGPAAPDDPEGMHSPASCAVIGSVAAFNALKHVFGIHAGELRNYVFVVSPFLDVSQHPLLPATTVARPEGLVRMTFRRTVELPEDRALSRYEQVRIDLQPLFDPIVGYFGPEEAKDLRQLPLYHDAITVRFPRSLGRPDELVVGWGLDAEDAGLRTIRRAIARFASVTGGGPEGTVIAEFDQQAWLDWASAIALITSERFAREARRSAVQLDTIDDPSLQLLVRLFKLYSAAELSAHVYSLPDTAAYWAECIADGKKISAAVGLAATGAVIEALGNACSARQLPRYPAWRDPAPVRPLPLPTIGASHRDDEPGVQAPTRTPFTIDAHPHESALMLLAGVYSGRVELRYHGV